MNIKNFDTILKLLLQGQNMTLPELAAKAEASKSTVATKQAELDAKQTELDSAKETHVANLNAVFEEVKRQLAEQGALDNPPV